MTHNRMQRHTRAFVAHFFTLKRAKTDAATQNNCPVCYSLSRNQKLFNTKVRRGAIFI